MLGISARATLSQIYAHLQRTSLEQHPPFARAFLTLIFHHSFIQELFIAITHQVST